MDFKTMLKDNFTPKEGTGEKAAIGGIFVIEKILYFLFKSPYVIWTMSNERLAKVREQKRLDIPEIKSDIPYIVFLARYIIEFLFDCLIYLSLVLAPVIAIVMSIYDKSFESFCVYLAAFYYLPLALRLVIEIIALLFKYGKYLLKVIYFILKLAVLPALVIFHFMDYLQKKCSFKADKYTARSEELKAPKEIK